MLTSDNLFINIVKLDGALVMIKKVNVEDLKPGMYIHDMNCSWFKNPFCRKSLTITDDGMIEKILKSLIREVYIDTDKGINIATLYVEQELTEEDVRAREIINEANQVIQDIMENVSLAQQVDMEKVNHEVVKMIENNDASAKPGTY